MAPAPVKPTPVAQDSPSLPDSTQPYSITDVARILSLPPKPHITNYPPKPLRCLHSSPTAPYTFHIRPYHSGPYYAISYTWPASDFTRLATSSQPCTIIPENGAPYQTVHFSRFAADALARLGDPSTPLWIDHECINQEPTSPEKAAQIAAMDNIYNEATGVLVLLEDTGLDSATLQWLKDTKVPKVGREADRLVEVTGKILGARWFSRSWCSQEMALSTRTYVFLHNFTRPDEPHWVAPPLIRDWNELGRARNPRARMVVQPQAAGVRGFGLPVGWAAGIVSNLGCWDPWDKVRLILNLMRIPRGERGLQLPSDAAGADGTKFEIAASNVWRLVNLWAIKRHDFSVLLGGHRTDLEDSDRQNSFMLWAGVGRHGDRIADTWKPSAYEVARQPRQNLISMKGKGSITLAGLARRVTVAAEEWAIWRDKSGDIFVKVGIDKAQHVPNILKNCEYADEKALEGVINAVCAFYHMKRKDLYSHMRCADESWLYTLPFDHSENMNADLERLFLQRSGRRMKHLTEALAGAKREDGVLHFHVVEIDDKFGTPPMIVYGNGADQLQVGRTIFQPWAIRPVECVPEAMTCNMMVLERKGAEWKCVGGVRCLGMLLDPAHVPGQAVEATLEIM